MSAEGQVRWTALEAQRPVCIVHRHLAVAVLPSLRSITVPSAAAARLSAHQRMPIHHVHAA